MHLSQNQQLPLQIVSKHTCIWCSWPQLCDYNFLPQVWSNERVPSEHGASLSVGQVGSGLSVDSKYEVTNPQTSITANGATVDYTADQHPQTIFHGAHCHPFEVDDKNQTLEFDQCSVIYLEICQSKTKY